MKIITYYIKNGIIKVIEDSKDFRIILCCEFCFVFLVLVLFYPKEEILLANDTSNHWKEICNVARPHSLVSLHGKTCTVLH